jgi:hypothetical protein
VQAIRANEVTIPAETLHAIAQNALALEQLTVHWRRVRSTSLEPKELFGYWKVADEKTFFEPSEHRCSLQARKKRISGKIPQTDERQAVYTYIREWAYDNEVVFTRENRAGFVHKLSILLQQSPNSQCFEIPYLEAAGFHVHATPTTWDRPPQSRLLALLEQGAKLVHVGNDRLANDTCVRVDVLLDKKMIRFFLDPNCGHALRRYEELLGGNVVKTVENSDFQELSKRSVWMPKRCQTQRYTWVTKPNEISKKPIVIDTLTVTKLDQSLLADEHFRLTFETGMVVADSRPPEAAKSPKGYAIFFQPAQPEELQAAIEKGIGKRIASAKPLYRHWLFMLTVALLSVAVAVVLLRAWRRRVSS